MNRDHTIDAYRGFAIIGMVFFTATLRLSRELPEPLRHNVWGSLHLGDFILPMFLFASGLSLAYFLHKKEREEQNVFLQDVLGRFGKLILVGVLLSFFSAYGFLEMDEVILSAILFIVCVAFSKFDWKIILGIIFFINISYILIIQLGWVSIFIGHYLGGYPAALYYLPVMLIGLMLGKGIISKGLWCQRNILTILLIFVFFIIFWGFIPINKMTASPSFVMLSILFSFMVFAVLEKIVTKITSFKELEYLGRKPLRYWILMYIIFIIPLWFYIEYTGQVLPLSLPWFIGLALSLVLMLLFWVISHMIDRINPYKIKDKY